MSTLEHPQAVVKSQCDKLEQFQRKLCLKDNGSNSEEIGFLLRQFEKARSEMLATKDYAEALTIFFNLLHDPKIHPLMEKYKLKV